MQAFTTYKKIISVKLVSHHWIFFEGGTRFW